LIANNYTLVPAKENKHLFTPTQKLFWDKLFGDDDSDTTLNRADFNPKEFSTFLPNIWMAELLVDENSQLADIRMTLVGTKVAKVYGEITNQLIIEDESENSLKYKMKDTYKRFIMLSHELLEKDIPFYTHVEYLEENKNYVTATALTFPMCKNSPKTNMILGYVEITYR